MKLATLALLTLLAASCGSDKVPTIVEPPLAEAFCPTAFTWNYVDSTLDYEEHSREIYVNTYKLSFSADSLVEGKGELVVKLDYRDGSFTGSAAVQVLWPFIGYYKERDGDIDIYYGDIWLARDDIRIRRFGGGLVIESLNPEIELHMLWQKC